MTPEERYVHNINKAVAGRFKCRFFEIGEDVSETYDHEKYVACSKVTYKSVHGKDGEEEEPSGIVLTIIFGSAIIIMGYIILFGGI